MHLQKKLVLATLSVAGILSIPLVASSGDGCLNGDIHCSGFPSVSGLSWYSDPALSSQFYIDTYIKPSAAKWNNLSSKVRLTQVNSASTSKVQAKPGRSDMSGLLAVTSPDCTILGIPVSGENCYRAPTNSWSRAVITSFTNQQIAYALTRPQVATVITHEFGHTLSLAHPDNLNPMPSIMRSTLASYNLNAPTAFDQINLQGKWGK